MYNLPLGMIKPLVNSSGQTGLLIALSSYYYSEWYGPSLDWEHTIHIWRDDCVDHKINKIYWEFLIL